MAAAVTRKECDGHAVQLADNKRVRGFAEGRIDLDLARVCKFGHLVEPAAANDSYLYLFHNYANN